MKQKIIELLPKRIASAILSADIDGLILEEIRIRKNRQAYLIASGKNILINVVTSESEIQDILKTLTKSSLYAHKDTISNGFIILEDGIRIGVIGTASTEEGDLFGVYDINEFAIRIPNKIKVKSGKIVELISFGSVLIYSPPGVGKTTLLRSIIKEISSGISPKRIAVIDTRRELSYSLERKDLLVSLLSGYPRKTGIEIAIRTMNVQAIVCDEIGDERDARAFIDAQGAGVPIIASCHGNSIRDILSHTGIRELHKARIFNYYVAIKRNSDLGFDYQISSWEEANAYV